jgi:hypothetical protein
MSTQQPAVTDARNTGSPIERDTVPSQPRRRKLALRVLLVVLIIRAAVLVWRLLLARPQVPANVVQLSGRIEGDDSARAQIAILDEQLKQYQPQSEQAQSDAEGRVRQAEADVSAAEATLKQQEASYDLAVFDRDAYTRLAKTGAVLERQGKLSASTAEQQEAALAATRRKAEATRGALQIAKANLATPSIRNLQVAGTRRQILQQQSGVASAAAAYGVFESNSDSRYTNDETVLLYANRDDLGDILAVA